MALGSGGVKSTVGGIRYRGNPYIIPNFKKLDHRFSTAANRRSIDAAFLKGKSDFDDRRRNHQGSILSTHLLTVAS